MSARSRSSPPLVSSIPRFLGQNCRSSRPQSGTIWLWLLRRRRRWACHPTGCGGSWLGLANLRRATRMRTCSTGLSAVRTRLHSSDSSAGMGRWSTAHQFNPSRPTRPKKSKKSGSLALHTSDFWRVIQVEEASLAGTGNKIGQRRKSTPARFRASGCWPSVFPG